MSSVSAPGPLHGEARYGLELARLLADRNFVAPRRPAHARPVLLIPGFMAGDASLTVLRLWLRRRGHRVMMSGIRTNVDCAERTVSRVEARLRAFSLDRGEPVVVVGQSRGGALARSLAVRHPDLVAGVVTLGSPVLGSLDVSGPVMGAVRYVARLGDLGVTGLFSTECGDGPCCAEFRHSLTAPLPPSMPAVAVYSRSDAIVDWRACLDPGAKQVEVDSSHCGMSVHPEVYRVLDRALDA